MCTAKWSIFMNSYGDNLNMIYGSWWKQSSKSFIVWTQVTRMLMITIQGILSYRLDNNINLVRAQNFMFYLTTSWRGCENLHPFICANKQVKENMRENCFPHHFPKKTLRTCGKKVSASSLISIAGKTSWWNNELCQ